MARERLRWTRTTGQRVVLAINVFLVVTLGAGALGLGYVAQKLADVERLAVAESLTKAPTERPVSADDLVFAETTTTVAGAEPAATTTTVTVPPVPAPEIEENYLIVGSDNAERVAADNQILSGRDEEVTNHLADTIMILRLRPAEGTASILSIPRDLEVRIAGTTRLAKINTAFNLRDAEARVTRLIDTIEENLDITLQHYIEVDLEGFRRLVDAIGGVAVCFDGPARDEGSGLRVEAGGFTTLDGDQALAYVRSRKLELQRLDGSWQNVSLRADLDRIQRQQDFVRATVSQTFADIVSDPRLVLDMLSIASEELVVSNTFNVVGDGSDLASWFRNFTDDNLETVSLDGHLRDLPVTAERNNEWRLGLLSSAQGILDIFRGIGLDDVVPARVDVSVRGAGRSAVADGLSALSFAALPRGSTSVAEDSTLIYHGRTGDLAANLVAAFLDGPVEFVFDATLDGNDIVVELGDEPPGVLDSPRVLDTFALPPTTTTTTVDPASTTTSAPTTTAPHRFEFDCAAAEGS